MNREVKYSMLWLCIIIGIQSCGLKTSSSHIETLRPVEFQKKLTRHPEGILLDIRTKEELQTGYIQNMIHIDYYDQEFGNKIRTLDKNQLIFVYCSKGGRSRMAVDSLKNSGFSRIAELKGGFDAWTAKGYPFVKP